MNDYGYNKAKEQKIFEAWFAKYEAKLKKGGVSKKDIETLLDLYWDDFNTDRKFRQRQYSNTEEEISYACIFDFSDYPNIDELDDERLYQYLKKDTHQIYSILLGIYRGLSIKEIAFMLDSTPEAIYKRIQRFKKHFNICPK